MEGLTETNKFEFFEGSLRRVCYIYDVKFYKINEDCHIYQRHKPFIPTDEYMKNLKKKFKKLDDEIALIQKRKRAMKGVNNEVQDT